MNVIVGIHEESEGFPRVRRFTVHISFGLPREEHIVASGHDD
jgi:hypothetical protein